MTEDDLTKFLEDNKEDILEAGRRALIKKIENEMQWSLPSTVTATVQEFYAEEIVPEIAAFLSSQKGPIIAAAKAALSDISDKLAERMATDALETLSNEYHSREVYKALFGVR